MLHAAFVDQIRATQTPSRVTIAKLNPQTQTHDRPHSYACVLLGRSPTSDVILSDPSTSRLHCVIYFKNDVPVLRDLDSRIGTILNGQQLPSFKDTQIAKNDVISLAGERFLIVGFDQKGVKNVVPACEILQETAVNCPFCGGQAFSFAESLKSVIDEIGKECGRAEEIFGEVVKQREKMNTIQDQMARIYQLHVAHYANVIEGRNEMKEQEIVLEAEKEAEDALEELRMSQLSESAKQVKFNEKSPEIIKKSVFSSFVSLFKSKKDEPEVKNVSEHKPTPFAKGADYEEEEESEEEKVVAGVAEVEVVEEVVENEEENAENDEENAEEAKQEPAENKAETEVQEEKTEQNEDQAAEQKEDSGDKPPSYHFEQQ